jgi:hypothetical protein
VYHAHAPVASGDDWLRTGLRCYLECCGWLRREFPSFRWGKWTFVPVSQSMRRIRGRLAASLLFKSSLVSREFYFLMANGYYRSSNYRARRPRLYSRKSVSGSRRSYTGYRRSAYRSRFSGKGTGQARGFSGVSYPRRKYSRRKYGTGGVTADRATQKVVVRTVDRESVGISFLCGFIANLGRWTASLQTKLA